MRTAWGVFKAARMTGLDDRGDFYRFWYHAVDIAADEEALESWKAMQVPQSTAQQFFVVGGNLILTTQRLVFEPYRNHRAAFGQHGSKQLVNGLARLTDRVAPRASISISLNELTAEARDDKKLAMRVGDRDGTTAEFFFGKTTVTRGDAARRDAVLARVHGQRSRSARPAPDLARTGTSGPHDSDNRANECNASNCGSGTEKGHREPACLMMR